MPRLQYQFSGDAFADGSGSDKFLIDLSENLSTLYGKLIRQGQIFKVRQVDVRLINPNTLVQDEVMGVSGKLVWFHPTGPRKKAWKAAFRACQRLRRLHGFSQAATHAYDFRVGLANGYSTDVGLFGEGVKFNAWCNSDNDELHLSYTGDDKQSIFAVWNAALMTDQAPYNYVEGFGTPWQSDAAALGDQIDFIAAEHSFFMKDEASTEAASAPFQLAFSQVFDSAGHLASYDIGSTTPPSHIDGPLDVMCGLIGVYIDTTTVDDSESQTQDWTIEISVDVQQWSPIMKRSRRKKRKGRRKR